MTSGILKDNNHKTQFQIRKPNGIEMDYLYNAHQHLIMCYEV